jgi:hypothetical protein
LGQAAAWLREVWFRQCYPSAVLSMRQRLGRFLRLLIACLAVLGPAPLAQPPQPDGVAQISGKPPAKEFVEVSTRASTAASLVVRMPPALVRIARRSAGPPRHRPLFLLHRALLR